MPIFQGCVVYLHGFGRSEKAIKQRLQDNGARVLATRVSVQMTHVLTCCTASRRGDKQLEDVAELYNKIDALKVC